MSSVKLDEFETTLNDYDIRKERAFNYVAAVPGASEPGRNDAAYKLAAAIREKFDLNDADRWEVMQEWNRHNTPPLNDDELETVILNPDKYAKKAAGSGYKAVPQKSTKPQRTKSQSIRLTCAADIEPRENEYLIPEVLPKGKATSMVSQEGVGKSTLTRGLISIVSNGDIWPITGTTIEQGDTVVFSHEEDSHSVIVPGLIANGADLSRVHIAGDVTDENGNAMLPDIEHDVHVLDEMADNLPNLLLAIFDPITSYTSCNENSNREVRQALKPLVDFAARRNIAVLMLSHLSKKVDLGMINRTIGSRAWSAVPRMIWGIQTEQIEDEEGHKVDTDNRFLLCVKNNLGPKPKGIKFSIGEGGLVTFEVERYDMNIDNAGIQSSRGDEIGQWLIDRIGKDTIPQKELAAEAKEKWGISSRRLGTISKQHGVSKRYSVAEGCWVWSVK